MTKNENLTILVVDDDPDLLRVMQFILYKNGYNSVTAEGGKKAFELLKTTKPDLILLDILMPDMDGYEVAARIHIKEEFASIPIIFVTGLKSAEDKGKALSVGGVDFVSKPVGQETLFRIIEKHLKNKSNWEEFLYKEEDTSRQKKTSNEEPSALIEERYVEKKIRELDKKEKANKLSANIKNFIGFKSFLFNMLNTPESQKERLINIKATELYSILASELNTSNERMAEYIANFMGTEYLDSIEPQNIKLGVIPTSFCKKNYVLALETDSGYAFSLTNPFDMELIDNLKKFKPEKFYITNPEIINELCMNATCTYKPQEGPPKSVDMTNIEKKIHEHYNIEQPKAEAHDIAKPKIIDLENELDEDAKPLISLVNKVIENAYVMGASDIHIEPRENEVVIRYRIDGELRNISVLNSIKLIYPISARIKIMSDLDITEKRLPQDGRIIFKNFNRKGYDFDLRVSTAPMNYGEKIVMRILDKQKSILPLEKLGFSEKNMQIYRENIKVPYGMILHVGPTGSGKSMTLYAALNEINCPEINIQTADEPIEYTLPGINQMQIQRDIGLTFSRALRCFLRQDPDVILIGEIRDKETADIAVESALTGHLLLSTLHTNDAASTITRFIEMGIEPFMISSSIILICAQRLVRRLCEKCKEPYEPSAEEKRVTLIGPTDNIMLYRSKGCSVCDNRGYKGRMGVHEILIPNDNMRRAINQKGITAEALKRIAIEECSMDTLYMDAMLKVKQGFTSIDEVLANIRND